MELSGRVFARASADERQAFEHKLSMQSARVGVGTKMRYADAEVIADLASRVMLKDAYVRVHDAERRYRLAVGQFKAPFMARELESAWELPLVSRGLVASFLVERHHLGGRRLGAMAEVKPLDGIRISTGVFQGAEDELGQPVGGDLASRVRLWLVKRLALGASGYLSKALGGPPSTYAAGADVVLQLTGIELRAEAIIGRVVVGEFMALTALLVHEVELGGDFTLQPILGGEAMRLAGEVAGRAYGATAGVNVVYAKRVRAQLQGERAFGPGDTRPANRALFQIGARF